MLPLSSRVAFAGRLAAVPLAAASMFCGCADYTPVSLSSDIEGRTIAEVREDAELVGADVLLENVVVAAHDTFDEAGSGRTGTVHLVDSGNEPGGGMQVFGAQIQIPTGQRLNPGNIVTARGTYVRFDGPGCNSGGSCFEGGRLLHQLTIGSVIERVGYWQSPEPIELEVDDYLAGADRYVGNLITLRNLAASRSYGMSERGDRVVPFRTEQGVEVSAELYRIPGVIEGTEIRRLTGVASYFFGDFVMPRGPQDVELVDGTPLAENDELACNDGVDNDDDGDTDCEDADCDSWCS